MRRKDTIYGFLQILSGIVFWFENAERMKKNAAQIISQLRAISQSGYGG